MKKRLAIIVFIFINSTQCYAVGNRQIIAKELIFGATLLKDYKQTVMIAKSNGEYTEQNDLLGRRPHKDNVRVYMVGCLVGHATITYILTKYSDPFLVDIWQDAWIAVETYYGDHNDDINLNQNTQYNYALKYSVDF